MVQGKELFSRSSSYVYLSLYLAYTYASLRQNYSLELVIKLQIFIVPSFFLKIRS